MKKVYVFLIIIFILGFLLRFYKLGEVPAGLHTDEAYFGYTAYSILTTGREIAGDFLPIHLKSFLYSPAGYSYFSIPFVATFGLNEFSTRAAGALFGSLMPIVVFFLVRKLFSKFKHSEAIGLISALFIAISPWNINLARASAENVIVVFFITLGVFLYLTWIQKNKPYLFILSFACFLITIFTYQAPRSFLPLFLPALFIFSNKLISKKLIVSFVAMFIVVVIPVVYILNSPNLSFRIRTLSIFGHPQTQLILDERLRENGMMKVSTIHGRVFNNKPINYSMTFLQNYFLHFSYDFLLTDVGLPDRYRVPGMGLIYLFDIPFVIFGFWYLFNKDRRLGYFMLGWILLAPLGSALTFDDVPNLQRTLLMFPALSIVSAVGAYFVFAGILQNKKNKWLALPIVGIMAYLFLFYLHSYYVNQVVHRPWYRNEGYKQLITEINKYSDSYNKIVITEALGNPSMFIFFFNKYSPSYVQEIIKKNTKGEAYGSVSFDKYTITTEGCPLRESQDVDPITRVVTTKIIGKKGILYIDDGQCETPKEGVKTVATIKRNDGTTAFKMFAVE